MSHDSSAAAPAPLATPAPPHHTSEDSSGVFELLRDVGVEVTVEIGRKSMSIAEVLKLRSGSLLELAKAKGEPLDILVNGKLLGRGEVVVVGDRYGVRIVELEAAPTERDR